MRTVAEFGTSSMADRLVLAYLALRVGDCLLRSEAVTACPAGYFRPGIEHHVAEFPGALDEEIAGVNVAVVLHYDITVAGFVHRAGAGFLACDGFRDVVEKPDSNFAAVGPPHVEQFAQKAAVLLRRDRVGQGITLGVELGEWNELDVVDAELAEESVQLLRLPDIGLAQNAENVELHLVCLQQFDLLYDALPGSSAFLIESEAVVHVFGAVERHPQQPLVGTKKIAPALVEQNRVGLKGIADSLSVSSILLLQRHQVLEKR